MVHATKGGMEQRKFPIPPLETQQAIVAEIEAEQALVAANRELIERFEKKIQATLARVWGEEEMPSLEGLGDKGVEAYILALETINRLSVQYRVETFCYLICNAWELMLKAKIIEDE